MWGLSCHHVGRVASRSIPSLMMVPGARVALLKIVSTNLNGFVLPEEAWRLAA